ncbi:hypothetical protein G6O69_00435 [Pseudenhygromyxa sp. WMMC2535]|uniref:hypothetical protein n=1 Tax=Pseudenhygromyxa sp. WMMC2535 TaxID=2712867 RepID=UPI001595A97C|nr:hypothetical protein [Pseudenhygromyxa sp. WMMC2535]NVB36277.1 hypothetical protein [Pseudenhygromyxa sp. WMMC2535]
MRAAHETLWPDQQIVHRLFSIRWTVGCTFTRLHGTLADDAQTRAQIDSWLHLLGEIIPQTGHTHVSVLDTSELSDVPRGLWLDLAKRIHAMPRRPLRRAVMTADGWRGDNQAQVGQLITAGHVRAFNLDETNAMIRWVTQAGTIDEYRLRYLLY